MVLRLYAEKQCRYEIQEIFRVGNVQFRCFRMPGQLDHRRVYLRRRFESSGFRLERFFSIRIAAEQYGGDSRRLLFPAWR